METKDIESLSRALDRAIRLTKEWSSDCITLEDKVEMQRKARELESFRNDVRRHYFWTKGESIEWNREIKL